MIPSAKYDFKFKDYAPWVFRHLRSKFRLDPADYLMSLTSKYILSELGSPGKSGSFFYFSRDYKYIIKTIHHAEHKLLRKILPEYYRHVERNPNTLISQFYGLHRVKMAYGRKIHFVVMNNLFPPHRDIHQTFDLKGSTIGRDLQESDLEKNPRATMKDLNWVRRNRHLLCGPAKRDFFIEQLKRDVELLKKLKIMDYSLLVGIHDAERGNEEKLRDKTLQVFQPGGDREEDSSPNMLMRTPSKLENERKARELRMLIKRERPVPLDKAAAKMPDEILDERKYHVFYADDGGFRATHENGQPGEEIYYLGIIDCLTHVSDQRGRQLGSQTNLFCSMEWSRRLRISSKDSRTTAIRFLPSHQRVTVTDSSISSRALPCRRKKPSDDVSLRLPCGHRARRDDHRDRRRSNGRCRQPRRRRRRRMYQSPILAPWPPYGTLPMPVAQVRPRPFRSWMRRARPAALEAIANVVDMGVPLTKTCLPFPTMAANLPAKARSLTGNEFRLRARAGRNDLPWLCAWNIAVIPP